MLVLTRRVGEEILFEDSSKHQSLGTIRIVRIRGGQVRIALDFPLDIDINRREVRFPTTRPRRPWLRRLA